MAKIGNGVEMLKPPPEAVARYGETGRPGYRGKLEVGWIRSKLIRDIAADELTPGDLAEKYQVSYEAIAQFRKRHAPEIDKARDRLEDKLSHLWIAEKAARLAEYEAAFERIRAILDDSDLRANVNTAEMIRAQFAALKAAAEELGDLTQKIETRTVSVNYIVEGVDMSKLQ